MTHAFIGWKLPSLLEYGKQKLITNGARPALVVAALAPVLRGQAGRNPGDNGGTTRHLSGRSVRVLAFHLCGAYGQVGLAFVYLAILREA